MSPQNLETLLFSGQSLISPQHRLSLCSESPGYSGPVTRTMARQLGGLMHILGVPHEPDHTLAQTPPRPVEKKRRRRLSPSEPDGPPAMRPGTKRQRQSFLPCLRRGSLPETQPLLGPTTPKGGRVSSPCHSPRFCPATVIKSRVPLGPSALQNCSTPLAPPARDLNATFDLSEEPLSKLGSHESAGWENVPQELKRLDQPFIPRWVSLPAFLPSRGSGVCKEQWCCREERKMAPLLGPGHLLSLSLWSDQVAPLAQEGRTYSSMKRCYSQGPCLVCLLQSCQLCAGLWHAPE